MEEVDQKTGDAMKQTIIAIVICLFCFGSESGYFNGLEQELKRGLCVGFLRGYMTAVNEFDVDFTAAAAKRMYTIYFKAVRSTTGDAFAEEVFHDWVESLKEIDRKEEGE